MSQSYLLHAFTIQLTCPPMTQSPVSVSRKRTHSKRRSSTARKFWCSRRRVAEAAIRNLAERLWTNTDQRQQYAHKTELKKCILGYSTSAETQCWIICTTGLVLWLHQVLDRFVTDSWSVSCSRIMLPYTGVFDIVLCRGSFCKISFLSACESIVLSQ